MFDAPPLPSLMELQLDAEALQLLLDSGLVDQPGQVALHNHIKGLHASISFIERLGR